MTVTETEGIRYFRTSTSIILFHLLRFLLYRRAINFQSSIFHHLTFFHPGKISIVAKMTFKDYWQWHGSIYHDLFHGNYVRILCRFRDIARYWSKIAYFLYPQLCLTFQLRVTLSEFGNDVSHEFFNCNSPTQVAMNVS